MAKTYDVVIVGGGAGGIAAAASLRSRRSSLKIAIVEPSEVHYYQPGFTLVGAGVFQQAFVKRPTSDTIPAGCEWIKESVATFEPDQNQVTLTGGDSLGYSALIVTPGLKLDWEKVKGLPETLGKNGVTSNYKYDLAPYTWQLVQDMKQGKALFTQPPMPIKCAGAPQKALYMSANHWERQGVLKDISVEFLTATPGLFGVAHFVPSLLPYMERYGATLTFNTNLVEVDGPNKKAWFMQKDADGNETRIEREFDFMHVCPPQCAPDFIKQSPLANDAGWLAVDDSSLQSPKYPNVFGVGDVISAPNAKTAAAVRKQVPIVCDNLLATLDGKSMPWAYDGYGACPLTVERGKVVLAEFGYGGSILPTFPLDGRVPRWFSWWLKETAMPKIYWSYMLKGKEPLARPGKRLSS